MLGYGFRFVFNGMLAVIALQLLEFPCTNGGVRHSVAAPLACLGP